MMWSKVTNAEDWRELKASLVYQVCSIIAGDCHISKPPRIRGAVCHALQTHVKGSLEGHVGLCNKAPLGRVQWPAMCMCVLTNPA